MIRAHVSRLLVDDDAELRSLVSDCLQRYGMRVAALASGASLRDALPRSGTGPRPAQPFEVLLLDLMLPDANGLHLCRWVRAESSLPVIMLRLELTEADEPRQILNPPQAQRCIADLNEMDLLIGGVLDLLRHDAACSERLRVDLRAPVQALIDDLVEQGQPAEVVEAAEASARGGASVAVTVLAQPDALKRVLDNLIGSAIRHGGSARVSVVTSEAAGEVRVPVDDDGPGNFGRPAARRVRTVLPSRCDAQPPTRRQRCGPRPLHRAIWPSATAAASRSKTAQNAACAPASRCHSPDPAGARNSGSAKPRDNWT